MISLDLTLIFLGLACLISNLGLEYHMWFRSLKSYCGVLNTALKTSLLIDKALVTTFNSPLKQFISSNAEG